MYWWATRPEGSCRLRGGRLGPRYAARRGGLDDPPLPISGMPKSGGGSLGIGLGRGLSLICLTVYVVSESVQNTTSTPSAMAEATYHFASESSVPTFSLRTRSSRLTVAS
jgi:hypothetical protein